eukprot:415048-Amorphochlora_amoeboformis.AAC.2
MKGCEKESPLRSPCSSPDPPDCPSLWSRRTFPQSCPCDAWIYSPSPYSPSRVSTRAHRAVALTQNPPRVDCKNDQQGSPEQAAGPAHMNCHWARVSRPGFHRTFQICRKD